MVAFFFQQHKEKDCKNTKKVVTVKAQSKIFRSWRIICGYFVIANICQIEESGV